MATLRVLALAVARGRIGSVVLDGTSLVDWRISDKAAESQANAVSYLQRLLAEYSPDVVVNEETITARHKGTRTLALINALLDTADEADVMAVTVPRRQDFANKYEEADALVERYPELTPWKPQKRRFYDNEPRNTVLFEALSLAQSIQA